MYDVLGGAVVVRIDEMDSASVMGGSVCLTGAAGAWYA